MARVVFDLSVEKQSGYLQVEVGDVVELKAGDTVPADIRIVEAGPDLRVDNSGLTGESEPMVRGPGPMSDENPLETKNLLLWTAVVTQGTCTGIVYAVGDNTVNGTVFIPPGRIEMY